MSRAEFLARTERRAEASARLLVCLFTTLACIAVCVVAAHWIAR